MKIGEVWLEPNLTHLRIVATVINDHSGRAIVFPVLDNSLYGTLKGHNESIRTFVTNIKQSSVNKLLTLYDIKV